MLKFIKQTFLLLLGFSGSLTHAANVFERTKNICLNNEPCAAGQQHIDLNLEELHYYRLLVSLHKYKKKL